eukprot:gb/GECG01004347.1/.p1 GENE.gb/GECG01004347.1/~~gb/GECG01004347.1/.p1  ORF type:complete len:407 (+),score=61.27 gb/GECG01004347.1/:1-1221(+)
MAQGLRVPRAQNVAGEDDALSTSPDRQEHRVSTCLVDALYNLQSPENGDETGSRNSQRASEHVNEQDFKGIENVAMSEQALQALKLYVEERSSKSESKIAVDERDFPPRGFARGIEFEKKQLEASNKAEKLIKCCKQWPHRGCWRQESGREDEKLSLMEFLLVSKFVQKRERRAVAEGKLSPGPQSNDSSIEYMNCAAAVFALQCQYLGDVQTFSPIVNGWCSILAFTQAMKNRPEVRAAAFGQRVPKECDCAAAWASGNQREYPRWHSTLIEGVKTMRVDYFHDFIRRCPDLVVLLNLPDMSGQTLLHRAARNAATPIVDVLIANGAWVNICDCKGRTPLHDACWTSRDNSEVVRRLVNLNPTMVNAVDEFDSVPLDYVPSGATELHYNYYSLFQKNAAKFWSGK